MSNLDAGTGGSDDITEAPPPAQEPEGESVQTGEPEEEQEADEEEDDATNVADVADSSSDTLSIAAVSNLDSLYGLRELGREALCWQLSSAKPGNGVEQIRDQAIETYWQSDGTAQPHWLQVHFARRVALSHVCLYLDYSLDESYTPKTVRVECGMTNQDLTTALYPANTIVGLNEPSGWCIIPLQSPPDPLDGDDDDDEEDDEEGEGTSRKDVDSSRKMVRAHLIRISVDQMHQNGRDTHIRQVQLYGPKKNLSHPTAMTSMRSQQQRQPVVREDVAMSDAAAAAASADDDDDDDAWLGQGPGSSWGQGSSMQQFSMIR